MAGRKWLPQAPTGMGGVWWHVENAIPQRSGAYKTPNLYGSNLDATVSSPGTTRRAWCALYGSDSVAIYVGTGTKLWQFASGLGSAPTDRSGAAYSNAADWSFAQFDIYTIATNREDAVQVRDATGSSNFADLTGSPPKARIVVTQAQQVLLFDLNDGAEKPSAFASCAPGDHTDWSGAGATTATKIRHRPGKITAAVAFKDYVLVFKTSSVYRLTYTGVTNKWKVELISTGKGAAGKHDVLVCGDFVVFVGPGGAWIYDGASFRPIADFMYPIITSTNSNLPIGSFYDPLADNAWFVTQNGSVGVSGEAFVYNITSDRWGHQEKVYTTTGAAATGYVPLTGEPAAMMPTITLGLPYQFNPAYIDLSETTKTVLRQGTRWGNGAGTGVMSLYGDVEGIGGETITNFGGLLPDFVSSYSYGILGSSVLPGNTELQCAIRVGESKDAAALQDYSAAAETVSSQTAQRRFKFNRSAVYARFAILVSDDDGEVEVLDYKLDMKPAGTL